MDDTILTLYDTFAGKKRPLQTLVPGACGIYCCGPTVYDMSHIGHARAALAPDVLVRFLRSQGVEVKYVRNITDVDDKIIRRANEEGVDPAAVSERYAEEYLTDLTSMNMLVPDVAPKVTEHMQEIFDIVTKLVDSGKAYAVEGDVYYRVSSFGPYGRLSKKNLDDLQAGARVEVDSRKESPSDFALWKAAKPGEPFWESPWGRGRPGWHIECSAMSCRHLGETFDIHAGGRDLIFPHHENEIAQSQGAHGEESFSRYWMHNGFVNFAGEKMSKSLGNFFTIREVVALYHPEVLRYFLIAVHYRSGVNFDVEVRCPSCEAPMSEAAQAGHKCESCGAEPNDKALRRGVRFPGLEEADERVAYIYETLEQVKAMVGDDPLPEDVPAPFAGLRERFVEAMRDDLNTAAAIGELSEPLSEANRLIAAKKGIDKKARRRALRAFMDDMAAIANVLGTFERDPSEWLLERRDLKAKRIGLDVPKVEELVGARWDARQAKDWARADTLRDELAAMGVKLRDGADGSVWTL